VQTREWVFVVLLGAAFALLARPVGRELAERLEGPWGPVERAKRARWNTYAFLATGAGMLGYFVWEALDF
jgi:hypothetical protein